MHQGSNLLLQLALLVLQPNRVAFCCVVKVPRKASVIPICAVVLVALTVSIGCDRTSTTSHGLEKSLNPGSDLVRSPSTAIRLRDVTQQSGINFIHQTGAEGRLHLAEVMTGGLAVFDFDNDGWEDIYFCTGEPTSSGNDSKESANSQSVFYSNRGGLTFRDISAWCGLANHGYCLGITVGDYDNDGFADIYLSKWGYNQLLHNNGDGTFSDATGTATSRGDRFGAGVCFADFNNDGGLDLFVGNYVKLPRSDALIESKLPKRSTYPGPLDFPAESSQLLLNQLDGNWIDASQSSGLSLASGTAMGIVSGDFDSDGDCDVYVANDEMANYLFMNDGSGHFTEEGYAMGVAVDNQGKVNGSMGVDCADVDNDGLPDLVVTSFEGELVTLYQMKPYGTFDNTTHSSQIGNGTAPHVTWGCSFGDLDNDGDRDVYVASGHIHSHSAYYKVADLVFDNRLTELGSAKFEIVTNSCPDVSKIAESARATAMSDLDNDGDLDVVVLNSQARCTLLENTIPNNKNWLQIRLVATQGNRSAIGAKVVVELDKMSLYDEVRSGRGYQSYWGDRVHFGLGDHSSVGQVRIRWPNGAEQVEKPIALNRSMVIVQRQH